MEFKLFPRAPYDYDLMLYYLLRSDLEMIDRIEEQVLTTLVRMGGRSLLVQLWSTGSVSQPELTGRITGEWIGDPDREWISRHLEQRFHLQDDALAFYEQTGKDSHLAPLLRAFHGLKPVNTTSMYEALSWAILGQQINIRFAYMLKKTLVEMAGARLETNGRVYYAFPEPQAVAALSYEDLTQQRFSRRKAEYLIDLARMVAGGEILLDDFSGADPEPIIAQLVKIRGIGRWSAEYGLMRGLGHPDILPAADIGLRNAVQTLYQLPQQPDEETVRQIGNGWAGWRSWAAFYLWFSLAYRRRFPDEGERGWHRGQ